MYINITLIIQLINFGITYWFLNKLLFVPFIAKITHKNKTEKSLLEIVSLETKNFEKLQIKKKQELIQFQDHVKDSYQTEPIPEISVETTMKELSDKQQIKNLSSRIEDMIVEKVVHEY